MSNAYIKEYATVAAYDAAKETLTLPNLSKAGTDIKYNPERGFYIKMLSAGTVTISLKKRYSFYDDYYVEYSLDKGMSWTRVTATATSYTSVTTSSLAIGTEIWFRGNGSINKCRTSLNITSTGNIKTGGNVKSLFYVDSNFNEREIPSGESYTLTELFKNSTKLIDASELILPESDYMGVFTEMFKGCTALKHPPMLPKNNPSNCESMFEGCTSLEYGPDISSASMSSTSQLYRQMFYNCTSLKYAPKLPCTSLGDSCYYLMFGGCTSLKVAPELPATTMKDGCYEGMFSRCTALETPPKLPATTLAESCYNDMFSGCTSLKYPPELPATTLSLSCYYDMFYGCTALRYAPELPALTMTNNCYRSMFSGCTSLKVAPELPAQTLTYDCYREMFNGCTNLKYINAGFISNSDYLTATSNWVNGVSSTGDFIKNPNATWTQTGVSGVPSGWIEHKDLFTINVFGAGTTTITIGKNIGINELEYIKWSKDGTSWTKVDNVNGSATTIQINTNGTSSTADNIFIKGYGKTLSVNGQYDTNNCVRITSNVNFTISGPLASLIMLDDQQDMTDMGNASFAGLFYGCTTLTNASALTLPSGSLSSYCFAHMFEGCTGLTAGPTLLSSSLAPFCYEAMFKGCTSLTSAPSLLSTLLSDGCYAHMFEGCTTLGTPPALPATTLAQSCYSNMFQGCTSMTAVPVLSATTLMPKCYSEMFKGCTSLTNITLPATVLTDLCYHQMLYGCSNMNSIKMMAIKIPDASQTDNWVYGVKSSGTFVKNTLALWNNRGYSWIPANWTIQSAAS